MYSLHTNAGKLHLVIGPMFSGKTSYLMTMYRRYSLAGYKVVVVKYSGDKRYDTDNTVLTTHDMVKISAVSADNLSDLEGKTSQYDIILVDEVQFYPDSPEICDKWAQDGKIVIASGLSGDYMRKPFTTISELVALSDEITHLTAVCTKSGKDAPFSKRIVESKRQKLIGGCESYMAVSREHI